MIYSKFWTVSFRGIQKISAVFCMLDETEDAFASQFKFDITKEPLNKPSAAECRTADMKRFR